MTKQKSKKEKPFKVSLTWWVGWVAMFPFRLVPTLIYGLLVAVFPALFFSVLCSDEEKDQSKWSL